MESPCDLRPSILSQKKYDGLVLKVVLPPVQPEKYGLTFEGGLKMDHVDWR